METVSPLGPMYQAGTLSGNPVAMAAGGKTLELLKRPGVYEGLESKAQRLAEGLRQAFAEAGFTVDGFEEPSVTERGRRELPASRVERSLRTPFSCIFRLVKPSDARSSPQASGTCQQAASTGRPADEQLPSGKDTAWQRYRPSGEFPVAASPWAPAEARMNGYWAGPMTSCVA